MIIQEVRIRLGACHPIQRTHMSPYLLMRHMILIGILISHNEHETVVRPSCVYIGDIYIRKTVEFLVNRGPDDVTLYRMFVIESTNSFHLA